MLDDPNIDRLGAAKWPIAAVMAFFLWGVPILFLAFIVWQILTN